MCDSFFSDYHWKQNYLETTIETYKAQKDKKACLPKTTSHDIYYGNDCYGRGTFGGGEFNLYKAIDEIIKHPLSIAIFGQAFTYEKYDNFRNP